MMGALLAFSLADKVWWRHFDRYALKWKERRIRDETLGDDVNGMGEKGRRS